MKRRVLTDEQVQGVIDDGVMMCEECGWWVESDLIDDEGRCDECVSDAEDC